MAVDTVEGAVAVDTVEGAVAVDTVDPTVTVEEMYSSTHSTLPKQPNVS